MFTFHRFSNLLMRSMRRSALAPPRDVVAADSVPTDERTLREVVHRPHAVDRRGDALQARFQLQRQELGIVARLVQVATVEPQRLLMRRLPHVAQLALPGSRILAGIRAEAPA